MKNTILEFLHKIGTRKQLTESESNPIPDNTNVKITPTTAEMEINDFPSSPQLEMIFDPDGEINPSDKINELTTSDYQSIIIKNLSYLTKIPDRKVEGWSSPCIFLFPSRCRATKLRQ